MPQRRPGSSLRGAAVLNEPSAILELACTDLPAPYTRQGCKDCSCTTGYLARYIQANGSVAIRWVCDWCEGYSTIGAIAHSFLEPYGVTVDQLPLRKDNSLEHREYPPCVVCGDDAHDFHHWAPRSIFPDWPDLGVDLCVPCHRHWHDRMRSHGLRWPHELVPA